MGTQFAEDVLVVICFDVITVDEIRVEVSTKIGVSDLVVEAIVIFVRLLKLSLLYEIMKICDKKFSKLSTGSLPAATTLSQFWPK